MKLYRQMDTGTDLFSVPDFARASELAKQGDYESAAQVVDEYLQRPLPPEVELFLKRETVPWLITLRRVDEALERLDYCSERAIEYWGSIDERTLLLRNSQMYWTGKMGLSKRAMNLAEPLLADAELGLEESDDLRSAIRNNAARIYEFSPDGERADGMYTQLIDDYSTWGQEGTATAMSTRHNYADFLRDQGEYERSVHVFQQLLLVVTQMRGISAQETLAVRNDLAITTYLAEREDQAVSMWRALVEDTERFLGVTHPLVTEIAGNLLADSLERKQFEEATAWVDKLIEGYGESCDPQLTTGLLRIRNQITESSAE